MFKSWSYLNLETIRREHLHKMSAEFAPDLPPSDAPCFPRRHGVRCWNHFWTKESLRPTPRGSPVSQAPVWFYLCLYKFNTAQLSCLYVLHMVACRVGLVRGVNTVTSAWHAKDTHFIWFVYSFFQRKKSGISRLMPIQKNGSKFWQVLIHFKYSYSSYLSLEIVE